VARFDELRMGAEDDIVIGRDHSGSGPYRGRSECGIVIEIDGIFRKEAREDQLIEALIDHPRLELPCSKSRGKPEGFGQGKLGEIKDVLILSIERNEFLEERPGITAYPAHPLEDRPAIEGDSHTVTPARRL
jgi:hypothetical protein